MNTSYFTVTHAVLVSLIVSNAVAAQVPAFAVLVEKPRVVPGEPVVVDFVLANTHSQEICAVNSKDIEEGWISAVLVASANGEVAAEWGSNTGCLAGVGRILTFSGRCLDALASGEQIRKRALVVFLKADEGGGRPSGPLQPGRYTVNGSIFWDETVLEAAPVILEVVPPMDPENRHASDLVDATFKSFMGDVNMRLGLAGLEPTGSIKRILEECPNTVHALIVRTRLLVLQAQRLSRYVAAADTNIGTLNQQRQDALARITHHLAANPDDPLAIDLLDGKVKLLRRLEDEKGLRESIDQLKNRYPESGRARRAEAMWAQLHSDPGRDQ